MYQVTQLRSDNIVSPIPPLNSTSFASLLETFPSSLPSSVPPGDAGLKSVYDILPQYIGNKSGGIAESGKRRHGRDAVSGMEDEVRRMSGKAPKSKSS